MIKKMISILLVVSMLVPTLALANTQGIEAEQSSNAITLTQEEMQMLFDNQTLSNNDQQTLQIALLSDTQLKETEGTFAWIIVIQRMQGFMYIYLPYATAWAQRQAPYIGARIDSLHSKIELLRDWWHNRDKRK